MSSAIFLGQEVTLVFEVNALGKNGAHNSRYRGFLFKVCDVFVENLEIEVLLVNLAKQCLARSTVVKQDTQTDGYSDSFGEVSLFHFCDGFSEQVSLLLELLTKKHPAEFVQRPASKD
jgi:hypothetical protein